MNQHNSGWEKAVAEGAIEGGIGGAIGSLAGTFVLPGPAAAALIGKALGKAARKTHSEAMVDHDGIYH